ncbi:GIY-YIG nuclease family protein [Microbacterium sp.]|uniref:GIY-YIG nuclease family protein n=1 Tax=Microbacterium sp. TaxID=51671 RepID=UPI00334090F7
MTLTLDAILHHAGIDPAEAQIMRHAYVKEHHDTGRAGIHIDSTHAEILEYTREQSSSPWSFPRSPSKLWVVFLPEGGDRARLWSVLEYLHEESNDGTRRTFAVADTDHLLDLRGRLVIRWNAPRSWWVTGRKGATYPVMEIADSQPVAFPGFDKLVLDRPKLIAVMREHRYATWRAALASVVGIYLITDTRDGRQYVGKADGAESISQRWSAYAANGHGGNVELRNLDPTTFRYSVLRVFDPSTPTREIDEAESHFKEILNTRKTGLNRN